MATSNVDIANIALRILGEPPITSLTGTQRAQTLCSQALPLARDEVFSVHPWSSLISRTLLSELEDVDNFTNYQYVYSQPADVIRMLSIHQQESTTNGVVVKTRYFERFHNEETFPYIIESGNIYTDAKSAYARYIRREENPSVLPNYLVEAIGAAIAKNISFALVQNSNVVQFASQRYYEAMQLAMQLDGRSQSGTQEPPKQWENVF